MKSLICLLSCQLVATDFNTVLISWLAMCKYLFNVQPAHYERNLRCVITLLKTEQLYAPINKQTLPILALFSLLCLHAR